VTFSLRVANGDLALSGSQLDVVYGTNKLVQDLTLWVAERYGVDRFHPWFGSQLENYIGGVISTNTQAMVQGEVNRVLDNYQRVQARNFQQSPSLYSLTEILNTVNSVVASITYDEVDVSVNVSNAVQQTATISVSQGA